MIKHTIKITQNSSRNTQSKSVKRELKELEHKARILQGSIKNCKLKPGDHIRTKHDHYTGCVVDICEDPLQAQWNRLMPLFVEVYLYDTNETWLYHPVDLEIVPTQ